jgi:ribosomal protein L12E/L44/L45/RPP1/RPP2
VNGKDMNGAKDRLLDQLGTLHSLASRLRGGQDQDERPPIKLGHGEEEEEDEEEEEEDEEEEDGGARQGW